VSLFLIDDVPEHKEMHISGIKYNTDKIIDTYISSSRL
jgi:hypothetical protein